MHSFDRNVGVAFKDREVCIRRRVKLTEKLADIKREVDGIDKQILQLEASIRKGMDVIDGRSNSDRDAG